MRKHKTQLLSAIFLGSVLLGAQQTRAAIYLGLAIDGSGSISTSDFALQRNAYATVLNSTIPTNGTIGVGVWQFGSTVTQAFAPQLISSAADLTNLINAVNGMVQDDGSTSLGPGIQAAASGLLTLGTLADTHIIDVSTDGDGNTGINQVTAATNAIAAGIDNINGLGVGGAANLNFVMGPQSFGVQVSSFQDFQTALSSKIKRETNSVPEGGNSMILFALGFGAVLLAKRQVR